MKLSPAAFNRLLGVTGDGLGQHVTWQRAHDCPCKNPSSGAPAYDCKICRNGKIWDASACTHLALAGQKLQRQWADMGMFENGDVVCTIPSNSDAYAAGEFDRIVFTDSSVPFSIVRVSDVQTLEFHPVQIDRVFWLNADKSAIVDGRIPSIQGDGTLRWPTLKPPDGTQFTLTGRKHPEYFVFREFPQDRAHHAGQQLPRRVVLRSFDLYARGS